MAPWANALFAMDRVWWRHYYAHVSRTFSGDLFSTARVSGVTRMPDEFRHFSNSGAAAIELAMMAGGEKIVLLGYDCRIGAKTHWHGDHPKNLGNAGSINKWPASFQELAKSATAEIINCSPGTALRAFPTMELEVALEGLRRTESEELRAAQAHPAHVAA